MQIELKLKQMLKYYRISFLTLLTFSLNWTNLSNLLRDMMNSLKRKIRKDRYRNKKEPTVVVVRREVMKR